jgi:hypothetical protein
MITVEEYLMGRDRDYPLDVSMARSMANLLVRVNCLLFEMEFSGKITSGYRPGTYNIAAGGAPNSSHLKCEAVDIEDTNLEFAARIKHRTDLLEKYDLYIENPDKTKGWVHIQTRRPASGNRIFNP